MSSVIRDVDEAAVLPFKGRAGVTICAPREVRPGGVVLLSLPLRGDPRRRGPRADASRRRERPVVNRPFYGGRQDHPPGRRGARAAGFGYLDRP